MQRDTYLILKNPNYRSWLLSRCMANFAKSMQALIVAWQVYDIARQPLALGIIGLAEAIPFVTMGLWAGHAADRYEKKFQIAGSTVGLTLCSLGFFALSLRTHPTLLPIYLVMGCAGLFNSFEFASSSAYVQIIIPEAEFSKAAAWNLSQYQFATILGPLCGGWILSQFGPVGAYAAVAGCFLVSSVVSLALHRLGPSVHNQNVEGWESIKIGLRFLVKKQLILSCMVLDMIAVFFGDVIAILPVFAAMFKMGPFGFGILRASPAFGGLILSLFQANRPFLNVNWKNFLATVLMFGVCMISFGLSKYFWLSALFLVGSGFADGVSVIIRQSLYQAHTPDHLRGRITSVSSIFIRFSNEMGAFESGLMAQLLGARPSVLLGGCLTLVSVLVMKIKNKNLETA